MALTIQDDLYLMATVIGMVGTVLAWWVQARHWARVRHANRQQVVNDNLESLADAVREQWRAEEQEHGVQDLLPVRWVNTPRTVSDHWERIKRAPGSGAPLDLSGHLAVPEAEDGIVSAFERVPSRRLVVLGGRGAGKTVLVLKLVSELVSVEKRRPGDRVPVLLSIASWHSDEAPFREWLALRLAKDYPILRPRTASGLTLAQEMVNRGRVIPVLDGLDEMPEQLEGLTGKTMNLRTAALNSLNHALMLDDQLVLTCRTDEYEEAVRGGDELGAAAVIELCPLTKDDLRAYLTTSQRADKWNGVFAELDEHSDGPLAQALRTPLMAWLARTVYSGDDEAAKPSELLERDLGGSLGSREAVEDHLLNELIPTVFERAREDPKSPPRWTGQKAQRWLTFVAMQMGDTRIERGVAVQPRTQEGAGRAVPGDSEGGLHVNDLAWWNLYQTIPRPALGLAYSLVFVPVFGLAVGFSAGPVAGIAFGLLVGLGTGFASGFFGPSGPSDVESRSRVETRWEKYGRGTGFGLVLWLTAGAAATIVFGPATGIRVWLGGFVIGILGGGISLQLSKWADKRASTMPVSEPLAVLKLSRKFSLSVGLLWGLAALSTSVLSGAGLGVGVAVGLSVGFSAVLSQAWGGLAISRAYLSVTRRLPWRLMRFFKQAHQLGVFRQRADLYQFRHDELRLRLSGRERQPTAAPGQRE